MRFNLNRRKYDPEEWHWKFCWTPTRISDTMIVWLERVRRRQVIDDEGNWAGGYRWHWEYKLPPDSIRSL